MAKRRLAPGDLAVELLGRPFAVSPLGAARAIEFDEAKYRETANSLYALSAFRTATQAGMEVPEWVIEFFNRMAVEAERRTHETSDAQRDPVEVLNAFGFKYPLKPGRPNAGAKDGWEEAREQGLLLSRDIGIATKVNAGLAKGKTTTAAMEDAELAFRVGRSTVTRAWSAHKRLFPPGWSWRCKRCGAIRMTKTMNAARVCPACRRRSRTRSLGAR